MIKRVVYLVAFLTLAFSALAQDKDAAKKEAKPLPAPEEIIAKYVKAVGGKEAFLKHNSQMAKGRFEMPAQGINGLIQVQAAKPDKLFVKVQIPGLGEVLSGYDGKVGWSVNPATGPAVLEGKALADMIDQADFYNVLHDPKSFKSMQTIAQTEFNGKQCYKVKLTRTTGHESTEYFDVETGLQAGTVTTQESPLGAMKVTSTVADYKNFQGMLLPTKVSQKIEGMEQIIILESYEFDKVPESAFDLPPAIKPLVEKK